METEATRLELPLEVPPPATASGTITAAEISNAFIPNPIKGRYAISFKRIEQYLLTKTQGPIVN